MRLLEHAVRLVRHVIYLYNFYKPEGSKIRPTGRIAKNRISLFRIYFGSVWRQTSGIRHGSHPSGLLQSNRRITQSPNPPIAGPRTRRIAESPCRISSTGNETVLRPHIYIYIYVCRYARMYVSTYVRTYVNVCMYVCMYLCVRLVCIILYCTVL